MRLSGCLLLFLPVVTLAFPIGSVTASSAFSQAVSSKTRAFGSIEPSQSRLNDQTQSVATPILQTINRQKCGIAKEIKFLPPTKRQPTPKAERIALEEPRLRCGGTKTEDGRYAVAVVPQSTFSRTTTPYPTFFFYIPFTSVKEAVFTLASAADSHPYYETKLQLKGERGIIRFQLPGDAPHLAIDRTYHWQLQFNIQTLEPDSFAGTWLLVMRGEIQRIQPTSNLMDQLKAVPERKRPAVYAENGLWQDALSTLAQLRRANPTDRAILADWNSLLQQVDLAILNQEPILDVVTRKVNVRR
ncbi:MAG: DUF928 domain-containing protein [Leptolyngbyaceae cyanobacterium bins.59]|nr:DUF928 domain-containing protein [Leptolyngbyaceae cyanobacterium bins.59]